ncbi:MAG TPA: PD-(D/E)XK nuclease-like domain-containing protein [Promicromonospora sp.]|nr:PD-(D/E)XK nuclease-like domain-containing protein [Promicromonospora sp.]
MSATPVTNECGVGVHDDIPELTYHSLPGLSSTGVKAMLDSPARYRWDSEHRVEKKAFDLGHAVHGKVLGVGLDIAVIPDDALGANGATNTKVAKEFIAAARAEGKVPVKSDVAAQVDAMAEAVLAHRDARALLEHGQPEVSLLWDDPDTGVRCRGRIDYVRANGLLVDLKTSGVTVNPRSWAATAARLGHGEQSVHYREGWHVLTGERARMVHVLVETAEPHFVSVAELDDEFDLVAGERVRAAIDLYAKCLATDTWPAYPDGISRITPPRWYRAEPTDLYEEF